MTAQAITPGSTPPTGMRAFVIIWFGQLISLFGSALTQFAITIWAYTETGEATALALVAFFTFTPQVVLSPIAGALVDRWNRKVVMMLSDIGAGLATVAMFILYVTGQLEVWHLYIAGAFAGASQAFQFPAYSAAVTMMLPKEQYARATGMLAMAQSASTIFAPALAAALIGFIGIGGVMLIDMVTFSLAVLALAFVFIPQPEKTEDGQEGDGNLLTESVYGFRYILKRPSLLGLQMMFFLANLFGAAAIVLLPPMILARTGNNEIMLGTVQSVMAIGGLLGGLLISVWGGPKRRVHGVLLGMFATSLIGQFSLGAGQVLPVWMFGAFMMFFFINILNASNQAIWQAKVSPDVQGRVFSARRLIAQITAPLAMVVAGPLADWVFEPAFAAGDFLTRTGSVPLYDALLVPQNVLTQVFGPILGTGPGAGMGFMIAITGLCGATAALSGYLFPVVRNAEDILPDHAAVGESEAPIIVDDDQGPPPAPAADLDTDHPLPGSPAPATGPA